VSELSPEFQRRSLQFGYGLKQPRVDFNTALPCVGARVFPIYLLARSFHKAWIILFDVSKALLQTVWAEIACKEFTCFHVLHAKPKNRHLLLL